MGGNNKRLIVSLSFRYWKLPQQSCPRCTNQCPLPLVQLRMQSHSFDGAAFSVFLHSRKKAPPWRYPHLARLLIRLPGSLRGCYIKHAPFELHALGSRCLCRLCSSPAPTKETRSDNGTLKHPFTFLCADYISN